MSRNRRVVTADDAIRLQKALSTAVETWFESLPEAAGIQRPGLPGDERISLAVQGRGNHSMTLLWSADPARRVSMVQLRTTVDRTKPGTWTTVDKASRLINVHDLEPGTLYLFTLWVSYSDGCQDQVELAASTLNI